MFIQSGTNQIELPVFSRTCRSDLELRYHKMVNESVLPFADSLVLLVLLEWKLCERIHSVGCMHHRTFETHCTVCRSRHRLGRAWHIIFNLAVFLSHAM